MNPSQMAPFAALFASIMLLAGCASRVEAAPLLEKLQQAPLIRCFVYERPGGQRREIVITDPAQLEGVRAWIQKYAWPPIDTHTTGNVIPRGYFHVFDQADATVPAFAVGVFGVTTRARPQITNVSDEDWQKLLSYFPPK